MKLHPVDWELLGVLYWDAVIVAIVFIAIDAYPQ